MSIDAYKSLVLQLRHKRDSGLLTPEDEEDLALRRRDIWMQLTATERDLLLVWLHQQQLHR